MIRNSVTKPKGNKLPPSQLMGFVKWRRAPPVAALANSKGKLNTSEALPTIPASSNRSAENKLTSGSDTNSNNNRLHHDSSSPPARKHQEPLTPIRSSPARMMAVEARELKLKRMMGEVREPKLKMMSAEIREPELKMSVEDRKKELKMMPVDNRRLEQLQTETRKPQKRLEPRQLMQMKMMAVEVGEPESRVKAIQTVEPKHMITETRKQQDALGPLEMIRIEAKKTELISQSFEVREQVSKIRAAEVREPELSVAETKVDRAVVAEKEYEIMTEVKVSSPKVRRTTEVVCDAEVACVAAAEIEEDEKKVVTRTETTEDSISTTDTPAVTRPKAEKTPEEWQQQATAMVQHCLEVFSKTTTIPCKPSDGHLYHKEFLKQLKNVRLTYFLFNVLPLYLTRKSRKEAAEGLLSSGTVKVLCDTFDEEYHSKLVFSEDEVVAKNHHKVVQSVGSTLMNYSDCSDEVTYVLRDHAGILQAVLKWLQEWTSPHLAKELTTAVESLLKNNLSILHNISMREDNIQCLRDLGAPQILFPYLESHNNVDKLSVYATLADIVSEEEADKLSTSPHLTKFLLKRLENALQAKNHRCYGWSVTEIVRAVSRLGRNDANKRLLVEHGVLPLLNDGIKSVFEDEKIGCMEALWVLSFDKQNVKEIMKYEELLNNIINASRDYTQPATIRHSAAGILWQCREELGTSEKHCEISKAILEKKTEKSSRMKNQTEKAAMKGEEENWKKKDTGGHIMLSYQWADQDVVKQIRDVLQVQSYKVWMDIDDMGGSTLQAMAAAIEDSFVVIVCMSQKYKDSPNCRAEAEYAFQQRKTIIPLIMQRGYRPDGWLGMILGAKLFFEFSGKYTFESRIEGLLKAIATAAGESKDEEETDGKNPKSGKDLELTHRTESKKPAGPAFTSVQRPAPAPVLSVNTVKVKAWAATDVKTWLTKFGLNGTELERLSGKEIAFLHSLRTELLPCFNLPVLKMINSVEALYLFLEAPEFFYKTLDRKLHITTLSGLMSFTDALDDLPKT